jgi:hypothetical protein
MLRMSGAIPPLYIYGLMKWTSKPVSLQEKKNSEIVCHNLQRRITDETHKLIEGR